MAETPDIKPEEQTPKVATNPVDNKVYLPRQWPQRLLGSLFVLALIVAAASVTVTIKESLVSKQFESLQQDFYDFTDKLGFTVDEIVIQGRKRTSKQELMQAIAVSREDNIFEVDVYALQQRLEQLPWVRKAAVKKTFLPNVINITLQEKEVQSLWQISEKFHPIDEDGKVIEAEYVPDKPLLLIVGAGAPENINSLLKIIKQDKGIYQRVKVANFISKRRWNLVLDDVRDGITIKLPEENVEQAWKKLIKLYTTKGILKRKLTIIDLRLKGKVTVKLKKIDGKAPVSLNKLKEHRV